VAEGNEVILTFDLEKFRVQREINPETRKGLQITTQPFGRSTLVIRCRVECLSSSYKSADGSEDLRPHCFEIAFT
jgi:hypothetical protein